jgi:hypothetical protein
MVHVGSNTGNFRGCYEIIYGVFPRRRELRLLSLNREVELSDRSCRRTGSASFRYPLFPDYPVSVFGFSGDCFLFLFFLFFLSSHPPTFILLLTLLAFG